MKKKKKFLIYLNNYNNVKNFNFTLYYIINQSFDINLLF